MVQLNMDLSNTTSDDGFDVLPPNWYEAEIANSEMKQGQKGEYVQWEFDILGKPGKVWDIMSFSEKAYPITQGKIKKMAECCGHHNPNFVADTEELHGKRLQVRLKIEHDKTGQYDDKNKVTAFKALAGAGVPVIPPQAAAAQPAAVVPPGAVVPPVQPAAAAPPATGAAPPMPPGGNGGGTAVGGKQPVMPWRR